VLVEIGPGGADEAAQQSEQIADFLFRARPILRGETKQGEIADAELERGLDGAPYALDASAMTFDPRQAALGGPASVAVHDDCNVASDRFSGRLPSNVVGRKRHDRLLRLGGNPM